MTGIKPEWVSGRSFVRLHFDLIDALGGSWEAAALVDRIAFRAGAAGWWTATMAELGADLRLSEWKVKRAVQECRDAGMIVSERVSTFDPTLRWRLAYEGEAEGGGRVTVTEDSSPTVTEDSSSSPLSKKEALTPPPQASGEGPILALVASGDTAEPALFASDEVEKRTTPEDTWPAEATIAGCQQAWTASYEETRPPAHPGIRVPAMRAIKDLAKTCETLAHWRALWEASRDAGRAGRYAVREYLGGAPQSRYSPGRNTYLHSGPGGAAAALALMDEMLSPPPRPATGGPR